VNTPIRILGIGGSLRRGSYNRAAVRAAIELAPKGATVETFELDDIPPFNQDEEQNPPGKVTELKRRIRDADAILFVTPEYNWSVSGVLKNAIDWASRPHGDSAWNGKPAAIMGASTGAMGTAPAQNHLRQILVYLNMFPIKQFFFACAGFLFVFLTGTGCKKASITQQPALPVNVVTVVEKEVNEWDEFTGRLDPAQLDCRCLAHARETRTELTRRYGSSGRYSLSGRYRKSGGAYADPAPITSTCRQHPGSPWPFAQVNPVLGQRITFRCTAEQSWSAAES